MDTLDIGIICFTIAFVSMVWASAKNRHTDAMKTMHLKGPRPFFMTDPTPDVPPDEPIRTRDELDDE